MMRLLTRSDVQRSISMREAVEAVKRAFVELSTGRADVPLRIALSQPKHDGVTLFMPGYLGDSESLAVKVVSVHDRNAERGLPLVNALVIVIDPATGQAVAAMEGGYLTALRTGAGSGAATDLLARQDAEVAAIIGAGAQARAQTVYQRALQEGLGIEIDLLS
jgi:ornithine cyclodeaminase/alanine dehydrogenase-like protein (mu-crystallin family)